MLRHDGAPRVWSRLVSGLFSVARNRYEAMANESWAWDKPWEMEAEREVGWHDRWYELAERFWGAGGLVYSYSRLVAPPGAVRGVPFGCYS